GGGPADAGGAGPAAPPARGDGVQRLPAADGGRRRQADAAPGAVPGAGLRPAAGAARPPPPAGRQGGAAVTVTVRLFDRARALPLDLPPGASVGELRRALGERCPALVSLLSRSAMAVNGEFARDGDLVPPGAEIALLPPVSGG